jgi:hypothetical protein
MREGMTGKTTVPERLAANAPVAQAFRFGVFPAQQAAPGLFLPFGLSLSKPLSSPSLRKKESPSTGSGRTELMIHFNPQRP